MKRSYIGELEWALEQINLASCDRNPDRAARLQAMIDYGLAVALARRGHEPIPERPDRLKCH